MPRASLACGACLLAAAASAYQPFPWDEAPAREPGGARGGGVRPPARPRGSKDPWSGLFRASYDWCASPGGDISEGGEGRGFTVAVPAVLPAWLLLMLFNPTARGSDGAGLVSGLEGEGLGTAPVLCSAAVEAAYSRIERDGTPASGAWDHRVISLGVRASGPSPPGRTMRLAISAGWAWHDIERGGAGDLQGTGPYAAASLEGLGPRSGPSGPRMGFALDVRGDWIGGLDGLGGSFSGRTLGVSAGLIVAW